MEEQKEKLAEIYTKGGKLNPFEKIQDLRDIMEKQTEAYLA